MEVRPGDLTDPRVPALLGHHAATTRGQTAAGSAHALDLSAFTSPDLSLWTIWESDLLLEVGALKGLSPTLGEIKAMHTTQAARRRGAGGMMLVHLITVGRDAGLTSLGLETGSWPYFEPARALYRRYGFVECDPFGDYAPDPNSVFMALDLEVRACLPAVESASSA